MTSENTHQHICPCCNEPIEPGTMPLDYSFRLPDNGIVISRGKFPWRVRQQGMSFCSIDLRYYYIRGVVEIPIIGQEQLLCWGTWISVLKEDYKKYYNSFDADGGTENVLDEPILGLLANSFPPEIYPDAYDIKVMAFDRQRMALRFELEPTDHPLSLEQYNGITVERVHEIARHMGIK